ncbi:restriction endonuclease subunit S, partial [Campylobacter concisus]
GITATLIISKALFSKFKISFPDITEQQKIAEVLMACDDEINLLNLKLENLKKQKQGLMQKLLSGKVVIW